MALFPECAVRYASNLLDTADIVKDAMLSQLLKPVKERAIIANDRSFPVLCRKAFSHHAIPKTKRAKLPFPGTPATCRFTVPAGQAKITGPLPGGNAGEAIAPSHRNVTAQAEFGKLIASTFEGTPLSQARLKAAPLHGAGGVEIEELAAPPPPD